MFPASVSRSISSSFFTPKSIKLWHAASRRVAHHLNGQAKLFSKLTRVNGILTFLAKPNPNEIASSKKKVALHKAVSKLSDSIFYCWSRFIYRSDISHSGNILKWYHEIITVTGKAHKLKSRWRLLCVFCGNKCSAQRRVEARRRPFGKRFTSDL